MEPEAPTLPLTLALALALALQHQGTDPKASERPANNEHTLTDREENMDLITAEEEEALLRQPSEAEDRFQQQPQHHSEPSLGTEKTLLEARKCFKR